MDRYKNHYISETAQDSDTVTMKVEFGLSNGTISKTSSDPKLPQVTLFCKFWIAFPTFVADKARDFKFGTYTDLDELQPMHK